MLNKTRLMYYKLGAIMTTGAMLGFSGSAHAAATGNDFGDMAKNIVKGIADLPGLITALCYMFGILLAVLGIIKLKDHIENPQQTTLKECMARLLIGSVLLVLPLLLQAMQNTGGTGASAIDAQSLNKIKFSVN